MQAPLLDRSEGDARRGTLRVILTVVVVSLGSSFQFGFCQGIINNLYVIVPDELERSGRVFSLFTWSLIVSGFAFGGLIGSIVSSRYAVSFGRRTVLMATSVLVCGASLLIMLGDKWQTLFFGRVLCGVVAGIVTCVVPLYFAEIAPARLLGIIGLAHQLGVTLGLVTSQALLTPSLGLLGSSERWRYAFVVPITLALLECAALPFCPEPPTTHPEPAGTGERAEGMRLPHASRDESVGATRASRLSVAELLHTPRLRRQLVVSMVLQLSMQLCGIDALFYYSTLVFSSASFGDAPLATTCLGLANIATSCLAVSVVDKAGRRTLLLGAWGGLCVSHAVTALGLLSGSSALTLTALLGVLCAFAVGPGCVAWFLIADIFPPYARDAAMTVGVGVTWVANAMVAIAFPAVYHAIGPYTFLVFALAAAGFGAFTWHAVPETKGRSNAQIAFDFDGFG